MSSQTGDGAMEDSNVDVCDMVGLRLLGSVELEGDCIDDDGHNV